MMGTVTVSSKWSISLLNRAQLLLRLSRSKCYIFISGVNHMLWGRGGGGGGGWVGVEVG